MEQEAPRAHVARRVTPDQFSAEERNKREQAGEKNVGTVSTPRRVPVSNQNAHAGKSGSRVPVGLEKQTAREHANVRHVRHAPDNLRRKVDSGVDFLTTQMFFDNNILYNFLYRAQAAGIRVPVIAGVMPVTNGKQIRRICRLSGTALPPRFAAIVDRFGEDPRAMRQAGIAYCTEQIIDLIANGVGHVHIYTMNQPEIAAKILDNLSEIFEPRA